MQVWEKKKKYMAKFTNIAKLFPLDHNLVESAPKTKGITR